MQFPVTLSTLVCNLGKVLLLLTFGNRRIGSHIEVILVKGSYWFAKLNCLWIQFTLMADLLSLWRLD